MELLAYDQFLAWRPRTAEPDPRIVLVAITESEMEQWGWPLSDEILAELLDRLTAHRPRAIGVDIYRDRPQIPGQDKLTSVLASNKSIVWVMKYGDKNNPGILPPQVLNGTDQIGFGDVITDPGGIVRRGALFFDDGNTTYYSLALRLALRYLGAEGITPQPGEPSPDYLRLGRVTLPPFESDDGGYVNADARGYQILLDFQDSYFKRVSMTDVLSQRVPPEAIRDKIVIVGVIAESVKDFFFTPVTESMRSDPKVFGIEIHAHVASQLLRAALQGDTPIKTLSDWQEGVWICMWTMLGGFVGLRVRAAWRIALASVTVLLVLGALCYFVFRYGWWIPLVPAAQGWFFAAAAVTAYVSYWEKEQRTLLMQLFSRHVSPSVANIIWQQRDQLLESGRLRPQQLTVTVLFTDLKGFTSVSEKLDPQTLADWLNRYMDTMVHLVIDHGGIVNKFIGDAIMAVFGAPLPSSSAAEIRRDATNAIACALAMDRELKRLNAVWTSQGLPATAMRIGIFTGPVVAGSLGSSLREEYTVIGDTVNVASRLESFDKSLESPEPGSTCRILIGATTLQYLDDQFDTVRVGSVRLKGKDEQVEVYLVKGRAGQGKTQLTRETIE